MGRRRKDEGQSFDGCHVRRRTGAVGVRPRRITSVIRQGTDYGISLSLMI